MDVPEKLTDAENVAFSFSGTKCANVTSQLRPLTSGLFHVKEWGKNPSASQPHLSVFQPNSTNQSTVLVNIWSNSACWVNYRIGHGQQEVMDFTSLPFSKRKMDSFLIFYTFFQDIFGVFWETRCYFITMWSMRKVFDFLWWEQVILALFVEHWSVGLISLSKRKLFRSVRVRNILDPFSSFFSSISQPRHPSIGKLWTQKKFSYRKEQRIDMAARKVVFNLPALVEEESAGTLTWQTFSPRSRYNTNTVQYADQAASSAPLQKGQLASYCLLVRPHWRAAEDERRKVPSKSGRRRKAEGPIEERQKTKSGGSIEERQKTKGGRPHWKAAEDEKRKVPLRSGRPRKQVAIKIIGHSQDRKCREKMDIFQIKDPGDAVIEFWHRPRTFAQICVSPHRRIRKVNRTRWFRSAFGGTSGENVTNKTWTC